LGKRTPKKTIVLNAKWTHWLVICRLDPNVQYYFSSSHMWVETFICVAPKCFFFTYVNKKTTCGPTNVQYQKKSPIWIFLNHLCTHKRELSFLTILFFPFTYVGKKNHLWAHKCAIPFFPSPMWEKKPLVSSQVCNTIFSFTYVRKKNHQRAH